MALSDLIIGAESGGRNIGNPRSSAYGPGQFLESTWLDMLRRNRPDLASLPRDQQLALRSDPALSRQMTEAYAAQNADFLRQRGHEPTPGNTYLAHFAGPTGAAKVLGADPNARAADVLGPQVVAANPFLANMTTGDLRSWANRKMGAPTPPGAIPIPQQAPNLPLFPPNAMASAAPQTPNMRVAGGFAAFPPGAPQAQPQPAGQAPGPSIWSLLGIPQGSAPSGLGLDWFNRQNTMTG